MPSTDAFVGTRIREYEILSVIGKGGMGAVYKARHQYLDQERAIKVIQARLTGDDKFVDRFIREAKIMVRLQHPNLVQLYDFGTLGEDSFFMVLELIRGESVLQRMQQLRTIPLDAAIEMIRGAAAGLQKAHQNGVVHRDISPDNLMLVQDDEGKEKVKLLDFGIAKPTLEAGNTFTQVNRFLGKPEYCSPEQCGKLKAGEKIDGRSDIYSLAITFYQMVTGNLPFQARSAHGYWMKHLQEIPPRLSTNFAPDEIPEPLDLLIERCLAKNRDDRPASMQEFLDELEWISPTGKISVAKARAHDLAAGDMFLGRYKIEQKLGEGSVGSVVYKAMDNMLETPVALKAIPLSAAGGKSSFKRFKRGVILGRKVVHPNLCRIYEFGEGEGLQYLAQEFIFGQTLEQILVKKSKLPVSEALQIIRQILLALSEMHRAGIVHRDVKPRNIMINAEAHAWIVDFALAISIETPHTTKTGALIGTPYYMAPEQFRGKNVDSRADLYSLGIVLYEMITGKVPFTGSTPMEVIEAHLKSQPVSPREYLPGIPPLLEKIILKALQKESADRYQSADQMLHELDSLLEEKKEDTKSAFQEQQVLKFMAEKNYSRAVELLEQMLLHEPENEEWKKLLRTVRNQKFNREVRRIKKFLKEKNLLQAGNSLDKMKRQYSQSANFLKKLQKLEVETANAKTRLVDAYLDEASGFLNKQEQTSAFRLLQAAQSLQPSHPRLSELQQKAIVLQQKQDYHRIKTLSEDMKSFQDSTEVREATSEVVTLLNEFIKETDNAEAIALRNQVIGLKADVEEKHELSALIGEIFEKVATGEVDNAKHAAEKLDQRKELGSVKNAIDKIVSQFSEQEYEAALREMDNLKSSLSGALSLPKDYLNQFTGVMRLLHNANGADYAKLIEEGKSLQRQLRWEEAVAVYTKAEKLFAEQSDATDLIGALQSKMRAESMIRTQLKTDLKRAEKLIAENNYAKARSVLQECERVFESEFRLKDLKDKASELSATSIQKEEEYKIRLKQELAEAQSLVDDRQLREAQKKLKAVLIREPGLEEAVGLDKIVESAVSERERFYAAYQKGKECYDQGKWQNAVQYWEKAAEIRPLDAHLQLWLSRAKDKLQR